MNFGGGVDDHQAVNRGTVVNLLAQVAWGTLLIMLQVQVVHGQGRSNTKVGVESEKKKKKSSK